MRIVCAWCGEQLGEKEPLLDDRATHTICDPCRARLDNADREQRKTLRGLANEEIDE